MKNSRVLLSILLLLTATLACNLPGGAPAEQAANPEIASATPTNTPGTAAGADTSACLPSLQATTVVNVRKGPGQNYSVIGTLPQGGTAPVAGKSADGAWWNIEFAAGEAGHAWVAGSVTTAFCIPDTLAVITADPAPVAQAPAAATEPPSNPVAEEDEDAPAESSEGSAPAVEPTLPLLVYLLPVAAPVDIAPIGVMTNYTYREIYFSVQFVNDDAISTNFEFKVWVDGALVKTGNSPVVHTGISTYTASFVPPVFGLSVVIRIKMDTTNAIAESNEANNELIVTCNLAEGC